MQQEQRVLDFTAAKARRDAGMQRAVDHADRKIDGWQDMALEAFRDYARRHVTFTTEQVRVASPNVPNPPDKRAWGHVARRACKEGIVHKIGMVQAKSPTVHCMYVTLYESRVLDLTAHLDREEWAKLMRSYVRAFRHNVMAEGFQASALLNYAVSQGMSSESIAGPEQVSWLYDLLREEGLHMQPQTLVWVSKACCADCEEKAQ